MSFARMALWRIMLSHAQRMEMHWKSVSRRTSFRQRDSLPARYSRCCFSFPIVASLFLTTSVLLAYTLLGTGPWGHRSTLLSEITSSGKPICADAPRETDSSPGWRSAIVLMQKLLSHGEHYDVRQHARWVWTREHLKSHRGWQLNSCQWRFIHINVQQINIFVTLELLWNLTII